MFVGDTGPHPSTALFPREAVSHLQGGDALPTEALGLTVEDSVDGDKAGCNEQHRG